MSALHVLIPTRVSHQMTLVLLPPISIPKVEECKGYLSSRITHPLIYACILLFFTYTVLKKDAAMKITNYLVFLFILLIFSWIVYAKIFYS